MKKLYDIKYGEQKENLLDIYIPDKNNFKTVVWIHGGGLEEGDKNGIHFAEDLLKLGYGLVTINYRLYPNAVFPDYIIDAAKAVGYVFRHIKGYGGTGEIYVTGQSAGAYITMMLCLNDKYLKAEGIEVGQVAGFIADSAQLTTHFNVLRERGIDTRLERIEEAAPLYYLKEKMAFKRLLLI